MKILIDSDGVIVDLLPTWLREYRALSGDAIQQADIKAYNHEQFVKHPKLFWEALSSGDCFRKSWPMANAIEALRYLNMKHEVFIVTYVHESVKDGHEAKLDWYRHWAPFIVPDQLIFTKHKHLVQGDFLVEDSVDNLRNWINYNGCRGFLMSHLYNKGETVEWATRVSDLFDVAVRLEEF